jgi:hypothetical protein
MGDTVQNHQVPEPPKYIPAAEAATATAAEAAAAAAAAAEAEVN